MAGDRDVVAQLLERHGLELIDAGDAEIVRTSMKCIEGMQDRSAMLVAVEGALASQMGHHDSAEAWLTRAIERASDPDEKASLLYRSCVDQLRRGRADCIEILQSYVDRPGPIQAAMNATLATAYSMIERMDEARHYARRARDFLNGSAHDAIAARTLHQLGYVALRTGDFADAKSFANQAVCLALFNGDHNLAARAYSLLYELAYAIDCDPAAASRYLSMVKDCADKTGDAYIRVWAILGLLYVEAEAGNLKAMHAHEETLKLHDVAQSVVEIGQGLLPAHALERAWNGDFQQAYRLVAQSAEVQPTTDRRALRFAEAALYAAASGATEDARNAMESADWALLQAPKITKAAMQSQVYLVLAAGLAAGLEEARRRRERFDQNHLEMPSTIDALMRAAGAICDQWSGVENHTDVVAALAVLRSRHLGGIARLFEQLPNVQNV